MKAVRPILIAAGGTGGHVFPGLAVADVLRARHVPVQWVGTRAGLEARILPASGIDIHWIGVAGLRGKNLRESLIGPLRLLGACWQSIALMQRARPAAVLGMGGFVSGPVGVAALLLRRPLVLHEQNAVAGFTNRCLCRFATRVFCAFPGAFGPGVKAETIGNPVRRGFCAAPSQPVSTAPADAEGRGEREGLLRILVIGGSRGARALNRLLPEVIRHLPAPVEVRHQSGTEEQAQVREAYDATAGNAPAYDAARVEVRPFIDDMPAAYRWADLVICRAGAMTVTELAASGVASILVPFPHAVDDHQLANAQFLVDGGAAVLIPEAELDTARLSREIQHWQENRTALCEMGHKARRLFRANAAEAVASALQEVARQ